MRTKSTGGNERSVLHDLRSMIPQWHCSLDEALRIAELQADRLLELRGVTEAPVPEDTVAGLPRVEVRYSNIPMSGVSYWNGQVWIIGLNAYEPDTRQRFTLFHEYKHIIDHGAVGRLYTGDTSRNSEQQAEQAADYFAGCVLMPRAYMEAAWSRGLQSPTDLAKLFQTSKPAIRVRLSQLGLGATASRCGSKMMYERSARPMNRPMEVCHGFAS